MNHAAPSAFDRWFGNSKVVDANGRPRVLFHGTRQEVRAFYQTSGWYGHGIYFTDDKDTARDYAASSSGRHRPKVLQVFLSLQAPFTFEPVAHGDVEASNVQLMRALGFTTADIERLFAQHHSAASRAIRDALDARGFDGVVVTCSEGNEYIAFHAAQVKSADRNSGRFDPNDTDMLDEPCAHRKFVAPGH